MVSLPQPVHDAQDFRPEFPFPKSGGDAFSESYSYRDDCEGKNLTELYFKDHSLADVKRYGNRNARHMGIRQLFDYREKDCYPREDKNCKNRQWFSSVGKIYVDKKKRVNRSIQFIESKEVFPELPKSKSVNLQKIWQSQAARLSKSKSCGAVTECDKIYSFKINLKNGLHGFKKNP